MSIYYSKKLMKLKPFLSKLTTSNKVRSTTRHKIKSVHRPTFGENCYFNVDVAANESQFGTFGDDLDNVSSPCIVRYYLS